MEQGIVTAIVTGASSGLGREFVRQIHDVFPEVERLWLIARSAGKLKELAQTLEGVSVRVFPLDLCDAFSFAAVRAALDEEKPRVALLVNNAGVGYLGNVGETELSMQTRMTDLNVRAVTAMTALVLPHMPKGGRILNVSSIAAFCPTPRMTVYSASKAYVSAFTTGLNREIAGRSLTATAVCPGPMDTAFEKEGRISGNSRMFDILPYCDQVRVARGGLEAARAGRAVYTPRMMYKCYRLIAKLLPAELLSRFTRV